MKFLLLLVLLARAAGQNLPLPPLPYDYNALEPHIDEATMRAHHLCKARIIRPRAHVHTLCSGGCWTL